MMDSIHLLRRQLALKEALIASFVPPEVAAKATDRAHWEEEVEQWVLERMSATADVAEDAASTGERPGIETPDERPPRVAAALGDLTRGTNPRTSSDSSWTCPSARRGTWTETRQRTRACRLS